MGITAILQWIITYAMIRAAVSIGLGVITYGAVIYAVKQAIDSAKLAYNGMPAQVLAFLSIAGVPEALSIICGAVVARLAIQFASKIGLGKT